MIHDEFRIGLEFWIGHKKFRCTDVGSRTVIVIRPTLFDDSWDNGPPYACEELVLDEYDLPACRLTEDSE